MENKTYPNLFIAGAARCGTTSLYEYLRKHPQVYGPDLKEPRYLCVEYMNLNGWSKLFKARTIVDEDKYIDLYKDGTDAKYRMDGTPFYMYYPEVVRKIKAISDDSRVIISIRNPVDRLISLYNMLWNSGGTQLSFKAYMQRKKERSTFSYKKSGNYYKQIKDMITILGEDRVHLVLFDDLEKDTVGTLKKIYEFLGIDIIVPANVSQAFNSNKRPMKTGVVRKVLTGKFAKSIYLKLSKKTVQRIKRILKLKGLYEDSSIDATLKQELLEFYMDDIIETEKLTGFDLSAWKKTYTERSDNA